MEPNLHLMHDTSFELHDKLTSLRKIIQIKKYLYLNLLVADCSKFSMPSTLWKWATRCLLLVSFYRFDSASGTHPFSHCPKGVSISVLRAHKNPSRRHLKRINRLLRTLLNFLHRYRPSPNLFHILWRISNSSVRSRASRRKEITRKVRLIKRFIVLDSAGTMMEYIVSTRHCLPTPLLRVKSKHILCEYN